MQMFAALRRRPGGRAGLAMLPACLGLLALTGCSFTVTNPPSPTPTATPFTTTAPVLPHPHPAQNPCGYDLYAVELRVHHLINAERQRAGLAPLDWSEQLADIARGHSQDMAARAYFGHVSPEGNNAQDRYEKADFFAPHVWAENIFYSSVPSPTYYTQDELATMAVEEWMNSPGHRAHILRQDFYFEGIGVGMAADMSLFFTQNFAG